MTRRGLVSARHRVVRRAEGPAGGIRVRCLCHLGLGMDSIHSMSITAAPRRGRQVFAGIVGDADLGGGLERLSGRPEGLAGIPFDE